MVMFVKNNLTISRLGEVILGFGILFMGISGISGALNEAKEIPAVVNALRIPDESVSCVLSRLGGYRDSAE